MKTEEVMLLSAIAKGDLNQTKKLINDGGSPNSCHEVSGNSALMVSIEKGYFEIAKTLIGAGADVNMKSKRGLSVLMQAVLSNRSLFVKMLIDAGADINDIDASTGLSPLDVAKAKGYREIIDMVEMK